MLTVLIVDDGMEFRMLYSRILKRSLNPTFSVIETSGVQEGLVAAKAQQVDCVLLDYRLPDGDGVQFISRFRQSAISAQAAILLCTGQESEDVRAAAISVGVTGFLSKGNVTKDTLIDAVLHAVVKFS